MISRRHIRLKVIKFLYTYFSHPSNEMLSSEKQMIKHFKSISDLHIVIISFLFELKSMLSFLRR